ncbi:hypothetical protein [Marinobacterium jannaschii]|uniref:hypothetical protein n=1 Tax=Marinobacterium jannaschii TaxID=64970 RepID=UPI0004808FAD|nr:hypothetical protein [Marinobacterium jannaschii]
MPKFLILILCLVTFGLLMAGPLQPAQAKAPEIVVIEMGSYAYNRETQPDGLIVSLTRALLQLAEIEGEIRVSDKEQALAPARSDHLLVAGDPETLPERFEPLLALTRLEVGILYSQNAHPNNPVGSIGGLEFGIRNQHPLPLEPIDSYQEGLRLLSLNRLSGVLGGIDGLINALIDAAPGMPFMIGDTSCQTIWLLSPDREANQTLAQRLKQAASDSRYKQIEAQLYRLSLQRWPQPCS